MKFLLTSLYLQDVPPEELGLMDEELENNGLEIDRLGKGANRLSRKCPRIIEAIITCLFSQHR